MAAQSWPWDHCYLTKRNNYQGVHDSLSWLSVDWSDRLDPQRDRGCPTSNCSFGRGLSEAFVTCMSQRLHPTPRNANSCSCGAATSAGIVKSGKLWLDQERLYHKRGAMPSHPWHRKQYISIWVHRCIPRWIPLYGPNPITGVDL